MLIDQAAYTNRLRRVHPAEKVGFAAFCMAASLVARSPWLPLAVALVCTFVALVLARLTLRTWATLCALPLGFLVLGGLSLALEVGHGLPRLTSIGLQQAWAVTARSMGCSTAMLLLAATTPMTDLLAFMRRLGVPALVLDLLTLTYRSLFILLETAEQMRRAQASRLGYANLKTSLHSLGALAARLFGRSLERADLSWRALQSRGYDQELRVLPPEYHLSRPRVIAGACLGSCLLALALILPGAGR